MRSEIVVSSSAATRLVIDTVVEPLPFADACVLTTLQMAITKFVNHSKRVAGIAKRFGWLPGARYTNLRDVRSFDRLGFLDIDWKSYDFKKHLQAAKSTRPLMTVARDLESIKDLETVLEQAEMLAEYSDQVVVVPKDPDLTRNMDKLIPEKFILGFSVPTTYGATKIPATAFRRPVHLLGGRPDVQRAFGNLMNVVSLDCNRFTLDAAYGDYFDGEIFRPHPIGGYEQCIADSLANINDIWKSYASPALAEVTCYERTA